jgi:hypothetical protein
VLVVREGVLAARRLVVSARERVAHFTRVAGDDDVGAGLRRAVAADGDQGDAVPCPLCRELVAGKVSGKLRQEVAEPA